MTDCLRPFHHSIIQENRQYIMGFAILCIMFCHNSIELGKFWVICKQIAQFGVDIFLFLSGYGLARSYMTKRTGFLKRRLKRIIPSYLMVAVPFILIWSVVNPGSFLEKIWDYSLISFYVNGNLSEWYIAVLLLLYALYPLFFDISNRILPAAMICILIWLVSLFVGYGPIQLPRNLRIINEIFVIRIPVFILGTTYYIHENRFNQGRISVIMQIVFASILALIFCVRFKMNNHYWTLIRMLFTPLAISCSFVFASFIERAPNEIKRIFAFLGEITLEVYLIHEELISLGMRAISHFFHFFISTNQFWNSIFNIIVAILTCLLAAFCIRMKQTFLDSNHNPGKT